LRSGTESRTIPYGRSCPHIATSRLEIRLDEERREKLATIARARGGRISEVVRELIDRAYEDTLQHERLRAARNIAALEIEDVPEPDALSRQLSAAHGPADLP
jgi:hypothetical protein